LRNFDEFPHYYCPTNLVLKQGTDGRFPLLAECGHPAPNFVPIERRKGAAPKIASARNQSATRQKTSRLSRAPRLDPKKPTVGQSADSGAGTAAGQKQPEVFAHPEHHLCEYPAKDYASEVSHDAVQFFLSNRGDGKFWQLYWPWMF
jgi:hypothetical protein